MRVLCLRGWCWCAGTGAVLVVAVAGHRPPGDPETGQPERRGGRMHATWGGARGDVIYTPLSCFPPFELTFQKSRRYFLAVFGLYGLRKVYKADASILLL